MPTRPSRQRRFSPRSVLLVLCLGVGSFAVLQSLVSPLLPTVQAAMRTDSTTVAWLMTAYLLSASVCTPVVGRLGDLRGRKRMFVLVLGALTVGSLLAAVAPDVRVMIAARVVQGMGGGTLPLAFGIVREVFPPARVAGALGTTSSLMAAGGGLGLVLAGPVESAVGFRGLFWLSAGLTALAALAAGRLLPASPPASGSRPGLLSAVALSGWLVALLLVIGQGTAWGWTSPAVLALAAAVPVLLAAWVRVELRSPTPLVELRQLRRRPLWAVDLVSLLFGVGMYALFVLIPQLLQASGAGYGFGMSVGAAGLMLLPQSAASFLGGTVAGPWTRRFGARSMVLVGSGLAAAGALGLGLAHAAPWQVVAGSSLVGLGVGAGLAGMTTVVVEAVPREQTGAASGVNANVRTVGGAIGTALATSVVAASAGADGVPAEAGYTRAFLMLAATSALATGVAALIPSARSGGRRSPAPGPAVTVVSAEVPVRSSPGPRAAGR